MNPLKEYTNLAMQLANLEMEFRIYGLDFSIKDNIHINVVPWYHNVSHPDVDLLETKRVNYIIAEVVTSPSLHNLYNSCKGKDRTLYWFDVEKIMKEEKVLDLYLMTPFMSLFDIINSLPTNPVVFGIARRTDSEVEREYSLVSKSFTYLKVIENVEKRKKVNVVILIGAYHAKNIYSFLKNYVNAKNVTMNQGALGKLDWFEPLKENKIKISDNKKLLRSIINSAKELSDILLQ